MAVVEAVGLCQRRGRRQVIQDLSFAVNDGVTALLGPNGAGKTTLLETIVTLLPVPAGRLTVCGAHAGEASGQRLIRRHTGFLPQTFQGVASFKVVDLVRYVAWTKDMGERESAVATAEVLDRVSLTDRAGDRVRTLSGGMRQRLGIACALVHKPTFLVLDEPTVGLDPEQRQEFRQIIRDVSAETSVLISTHLTDDVSAMCDEVLVLSVGEVRFAGPVSALVELGEDRVASPGDQSGDGHRVMSSPIEEGYLRALRK